MGPTFGRSDFRKLAELLGEIKGRFVLSINDVPEMRQAFAAFHIEEVETKYAIGNADRAEPVRELLISNVEMAAGSLL